MDLRKRHPPSLSPRALAIAGWGAFTVAGALFLAIAWNVSSGSPLAAFDERVSAWLQAHRSAGLTAFFLAVTHLNSLAAIGLWSAVLAIVLARMREWYWTLTLGLAVGGAMLLNLLLKIAYERLRPRIEEPLLVLDTYSFPSGHTAAAVAFYGVLAAFLVSRFHDTRRRIACVIGAIAAVALVAFSRIYLGVHYLSDVLAAACSSAVWLVLCLAGGHALVRGKLERKWLVIGAVALLALFGAVLLPLEDWSEKLEAAIAGSPRHCSQPSCRRSRLSSWLATSCDRKKLTLFCFDRLASGGYLPRSAQALRHDRCGVSRRNGNRVPHPLACHRPLSRARRSSRGAERPFHTVGRAARGESVAVAVCGASPLTWRNEIGI